MTLLNRYILSIYIRIFFLASATFVGIYLLVDFFEKVDNFIEHGASASQYLLYFANKIPLIVSQVTPLAVLMAVFMTLGGLTRTNELTAIKSCGLSLIKTTWPLLLASLLTALAILAMNEFVLPLSVKTANTIYEEQVRGKTSITFKRDRLWFREGSDIVNISLVEPESKTITGMTVYHIDDHFRLTRRTDAVSGHYTDDRGWVFRQVTHREFTPLSGEMLGEKKLAQEILPLSKTPDDFKENQPDLEALNFRQLSALVKKMESEGHSPVRYKVDMHSRLATPFANVIMAVLGIPFALQRGRQTNVATGVALSIVIGFAYYVIMAAMQAFGYSGVAPPAVAAWSAHVLFALIGGWMLLSTRS
ncbi:LPS export ABC transporter permease LptG [Desulfuromonas sp. AOP6]|uniref:LPS export ABC transporter permease LptG n=1 Tax=Desulfuromonas sp. AOP6 TaxID=1566351 RepID=UPI001276BF58|nr:LPS export ABC transporter permease LptG [Desulfuromonas sp. AOP6]BCA79565.1 LPS export ABC transporter permease LptG [Desulfuromonas sp. AOP6]